MRVVEVADEGPVPSVEDLVQGLDWSLQRDQIADLILSSRVPLKQFVQALTESPLNFGLVDWAPSLTALNAAVLISATLQSEGLRKRLLRSLRLGRVVRRRSLTSVPLTWFECHVPHGGSAHVKAQTANGRIRKLGLSVFGASLSRARQITVSITNDLKPRKQCALYFLDFDVSLVLYRFPGGREEWGAEDVRLVGNRTESLADCRSCSVPRSSIDPTRFVLEQYVDRKKDTVTTSQGFEYLWRVQDQIAVSSPIPHLPRGKAELKASTAREEKWTVGYTFPAGHLYQPYRPIGATWTAWRWAYEPNT